MTEDELKQHFLTKVDAVSRVVINKSNIKRPPIVAYVWMNNSTDCKVKALYHTLYHNLLDVLIVIFFFVFLTERALVTSYIPQKQTDYCKNEIQ